MRVQYIGGYHEYIRGYEYIGGCSVHRGELMMHVEDIMNTSGCSLPQGFQYKSKAFINLLPHMNHDIPPMY